MYLYFFKTKDVTALGLMLSGPAALLWFSGCLLIWPEVTLKQKVFNRCGGVIYRIHLKKCSMEASVRGREGSRKL